MRIRMTSPLLILLTASVMITTPGPAGVATAGAVATGADCAATDQTEWLDQAYAVTGSDPNQTSVDVYGPALPDGCPAVPILFSVHGGGWQIGDKAHQIAGKRRLAREQGWVLVSVNYRLVPEVTYPVPNQDVADAIGWVLDHAGDYGADPERVAIMGHSAGAGIVAAVSTDERYLERARYDLATVDCTVALDTEGYDVRDRGGDGGIYDAMFGTDPAAWPDASPITHVAAGKGVPDHFIVTRGDPTRVVFATDYADALAAAGVPVELIDVDLTHAGVNAAIGDPADTQIMPRLLPFLDVCYA